MCALHNGLQGPQLIPPPHSSPLLLLPPPPPPKPPLSRPSNHLRPPTWSPKSCSATTTPSTLPNPPFSSTASPSPPAFFTKPLSASETHPKSPSSSGPTASPDAASYHLLIDTLGRAGQFDVALQLILEMNQRNLKPSSATFGILIRI
ncbi:hypothetical protein Acr_07g0015530 [Actinidia rufa]|uniref:Pentatricopeptide repeat (PPR) superfamily protein n=1 Tax=Actinidia rufa TaxID=165716 RepID=A0A7J0F0E7_9ERIC|nr:hypothetical protein Acr_07g0015530 [Actinidia rufa]